MAPTKAITSIQDPVKAARVADALKTLGHPVRLRIMACLATRGEMTVSDLVRELALPQALVSQQLARLRLGGLIRVRPEGGYRYYALSATEAVDLLDCLVRCCEAASKTR